ncbi:MCE family protein [Mycobacterium sp. smrl_JER01]|uniref:MCE family protein n=1 Tax=Mycobacterium sp. smrl_JER01 TaxID=3402633 RepID=UPI003AC3E4AF
MSGRTGRAVVGLVTVATLVGVVVVAIGLFRGSFTATVPVTVLSPRAGLVMNPDAEVKLHGAQVGTVSSIEALPDGQAALHLAMNPGQLGLIPDNVAVEITSSTVFGAKFVELVPPPQPSTASLQPGAVLAAGHVTVEINTVFEQLSAVLAKIEPAKLNQTLGALASAFDGRGEQFGRALGDIDTFLAAIDPSLPNLEHELAVAPQALDAYADAAPDLLAVAEHATRISDTLVGEQQNLDALLVSAIGLADIGTDVIGGNRAAITEVLDLLVPTTDLTSEYHEALNCGLKGATVLAKGPGTPVPGVLLLQSFFLGSERYRYPANLPKVAATGGPVCQGLPTIGFQERPQFVVADIGANPAQYGNQGILLNSDGLKQMLYGPLDGPPRNTAQVGHPG